jgi:hypothetical protein
MKDIQKHNLDYLAAKHAQEFIQKASGKGSDIENEVTKALGVLQENGVYACFLYLLANNGKSMVDEMLNLFKESALGFDAPPESGENAEILKYVADYITADLPRLLLAREALEQMLTYARYGAKAKDKA